MKRKIKLKKSLKILFATIIVICCVNGMKNWHIENISKNNEVNFIAKQRYDDLILVNKQNSVGSDYIPKNLVKSNIKFLNSSTEEEKYMEKEAAEALEQLVKGAKKDNIILLGSSGYRSYDTQVNIYNEYYKQKGKDYTVKYVAKPGTSEHQTGFAMDVTNPSRCFDKTSAEAQWLANNAYKYGFILRYPEGKTDVTGYSYEPWHIRYVGKKVAKEIYNNSETLEEYLMSQS
ncbi:M15 family metallopeptidase [Intestinibacter sp.]